MKGILFTLALTAALPVAASASTVLMQGETACRSAEALKELRRARLAGDQPTIDWLFSGAVCLEVPADTPVTVLAVDAEGDRQLKTTERRRNLVLWVAGDPASAEDTINGI